MVENKYVYVKVGTSETALWRPWVWESLSRVRKDISMVHKEVYN